MKILIVVTFAALAVCTLDLVGGSLTHQATADKKLGNQRIFEGKHRNARHDGFNDETDYDYSKFDMVENMEESSRKCAKEHGATDEDIEAYLAADVATENLKRANDSWDLCARQ